MPEWPRGLPLRAPSIRARRTAGGRRGRRSCPDTASSAEYSTAVAGRRPASAAAAADVGGEGGQVGRVAADAGEALVRPLRGLRGEALGAVHTLSLIHISEPTRLGMISY